MSPRIGSRGCAGKGERYFADGLREFPDNPRLAILAVCAIGWQSGPLPDHAGLHRRRRQQQRVDDESRGTGVGLGRWSRAGARVRDRPLVGLPAGLRRAGGPHRRFPERSALAGRGVHGGRTVSPPPPVSRPGLVSRPAAAFGRRRGGWQGGEHGGEALAPGCTAASAVGGPGYGAARSLPGALKAAAVRTTRCANSKPAVAVLGGPHGWGTVVGNRGWEPHVRMKEEVAVSGEPAGRATWGPVAGRLRRWDRVAGALRSDERGPIGGEAT